MDYVVVSKDDMNFDKRFAGPREAERALRLAPPGKYTILRIVADDVLVEAPAPVEQQANRVVVGRRSFTRQPKATPPTTDTNDA